MHFFLKKGPYCWNLIFQFYILFVARLSPRHILDEVSRFLRGWRDDQHGIRNYAMDIVQRLYDDGDPPNVERLQADLSKLYGGGPSQREMGDLIELLSRILSNPFAGNLVNSKTLRQLLNALTVKEEYNGVMAKLQKTELLCVSCQKPINDGQLVTVNTDGMGATISCNSCRKPASYVTTCCGTVVPLDRKARNLFQGNIPCSAGDECKGKKEAPPPAPMDEPSLWVQEVARITGGARRRPRLPDRDLSTPQPLATWGAATVRTPPTLEPMPGPSFYIEQERNNR